MTSRDRLTLFAAVALAVIFAGSIVALVLIRADKTYNYPAYSSLNNSADGTKAYFEALERLGFQVTRNHRPLPKLKGTHAEIFYAGMTFAALQSANDEEYDDFEQLAKSGARLILAIQPGSLAMKGVEIKSPSTVKPKDLLKQRWGIDVAWKEVPVPNLHFGKLKVQRATGYFASWQKDWSASLRRDDAPLFLERSFGKGSILLVSDGRYFTNQELLTKPDPEVLTSLPLANRSIIFDESHLGLEDSGTVIGLMTAHHLNWVFAGLLIVATLYIWRSSVSFIPPLAAEVDSSIRGQDAFDALTNLLMQSVPAKDLLHKAAMEWNSSANLHRNSRKISAEDLKFLPDLDSASTIDEYNSLTGRLTGNVTEEPVSDVLHSKVVANLRT